MGNFFMARQSFGYFQIWCNGQKMDQIGSKCYISWHYDLESCGYQFTEPYSLKYKFYGEKTRKLLSCRADFRRSSKIRPYFCQNFHKTEINSLKWHHMALYCHTASERGENSESDQIQWCQHLPAFFSIKIIEIAGVPNYL